MRNKATALAGAAFAAMAITAQPALTFEDKAAEVLAATRKAVGGSKLDALKTFSAAARVQRNVGTFQMNSDVELFLENPDKYLRSESSSGGQVNFGNTTGFNGDRSLMRAGSTAGAMVVRMGPSGPIHENPTPEQKDQMNRSSVRSARHEISRLMLGWFGMAHPSIDAKYAYVGEAESPDGRAHVLEITNADGFKARLFVDQQTHLPLMVSYQAPKRTVMGGPGGGARVMSGGGSTAAGGGSTAAARPEGGRQLTDEERKKLDADMKTRLDELRTQPPALVEHQLFFSDWADAEGIKFPRKIQRAVEGTTDEEWEITRIKVNPRIDQKKFDVQG